MSLFKKIVKGTGKLIGQVAKPLTGILGLAGVPGMSAISALLPDATPKVQAAAAQKLVEAAQLPPLKFVDALNFAGEAAHAVRAAGGTVDQANQAANAVQEAAQTKPSVALPAIVSADEAKSVLNPPALGVASPAPVVNSLTSAEIKTIGQDALSALKVGAIESYMNKTEDGKEAKKEAIDAAGSKALPYILGAGLLLMIFKGNGR